MSLTENVGKAAGNAIVDKIATQPGLLDKLVSTAVTALVTALIDNLPHLIAGIQAAIAQSKAKHE